MFIVELYIIELQIEDGTWNLKVWKGSTFALDYSAFKLFNPLTASAAYIRVLIFYSQIKYHIIEIKCDINQQDLKRIDFHFVKSESFWLTWSCGSRQRDTTSSGWKFQLNNLAVKGLTYRFKS